MNIYEKLSNIQNELKAPKSQFNKFGGYKYRSCEDILEAVKPICKKYGAVLVISDKLENIGDRYYIKAMAELIDTEEENVSVCNTAYAREEESKKGMDGSQITGTASSYARKYALNGMFLIDDTKDADTDEYHNQTTQTQSRTKLTKTFLKEHGNERISGDEIKKLKTACINAGESMSLERALTACKRSSIEEITYVQYYALMNQLGAVA